MVAYWTGNKHSWFAALERLLTSIAVVCVLGGEVRGSWVGFLCYNQAEVCRLDLLIVYSKSV